MVRVIKILEKSSEKRTDNEIINFIVPILAARNFFKTQKFNLEELKFIARKMEYRKLEPGDTVYRFKEEADYAYFIFKG